MASEALAALYAATNGPEWTNKLNWLTGDPCPSGAWFGITCTNGLVTQLNLGENNLGGSLPTEIGLLTNLGAQFNIRFNAVAGAIPSEVGDLQALTGNIYFTSNQLSKPLPSELGRLTSLSALYATSNRLTGEIPSEIGELRDTVIYLNANSLCGDAPAELDGEAVSYQLNSIGTPCCETLPLEYTCAPTPGPTAPPTLTHMPSSPSEEPSPMPTAVPVPVPTAVPVPAPTPKPSHAPTAPSNVGAVVGIVIGSLVALAVLAACAYNLLLWRNKQRALQGGAAAGPRGVSGSKDMSEPLIADSPDAASQRRHRPPQRAGRGGDGAGAAMANPITQTDTLSF